MVSSMTMPRRTNRSNIRPVNSIKHVVDVQGGLLVDAVTNNDLIHATDNPVQTDAHDVKSGSVVNSIFLNLQSAVSSTAALANMYMTIYKNPGENIAIAQVPKGNAVGISDMRKLVIHQEMIMGEKNTTAIPRTVFKGVIKLPRHMRRFGFNDVLVLSLYSPGVTWDFCAQCIYKEFS